ncbi:MAG: transposase, partial [Rikenellaceae bacterium]
SEAKEIIGIYNEFYRIRHDNPKEEWVERSAEVIERLERRLRELERDKDSLGNGALSGAVAYSLNELESVRNIISSTEYELDNNAIERPMRYISTSRKNSMFAGSMRGAKRMALIYSLAISCRLNGVNSFVYFCDVINRLAELSPTASPEKLRGLLPDKWKFSKL